MNLVKVECTDLIMEVDKHVLEAAHCFSLDSNWSVVGNWIQDSKSLLTVIDTSEYRYVNQL